MDFINKAIVLNRTNSFYYENYAKYSDVRAESLDNLNVMVSTHEFTVSEKVIYYEYIIPRLNQWRKRSN